MMVISKTSFTNLSNVFAENIFLKLVTGLNLSRSILYDSTARTIPPNCNVLTASDTTLARTTGITTK